MKCLLILTVISTAAWVTSVPVNPKRILVNRPDVFPRERRSKPAAGLGDVKGHNAKGGVSRIQLEKSLRKGEFVCEGKVCRLGGEPPNCGGVCQYPLPIHTPAEVRALMGRQK